MTRLTWNAPDKRFFEAGLDRGVFYPKVGPAVPWNGLTSVDEASPDSAVSYYIDGQAFLHFPKPKDFAATIKAYTYPDEFAEVMGLAEVQDVDGVYIDSQVGTTFDLSYRTLVGNGTDGMDHGYKIHLIYNATVTPAGTSFSPVGSEVNPTQFSWEINAVPVPIEGYRPTAHIIIDTRHMDDLNIAKIEQLIYGDETTAPSMPAPITIMELLSFGDAIIITDNGDGTWSVRASYEKLYDVSDGVFQIDGVEHTDYGDGTFLVQTTGA